MQTRSVRAQLSRPPLFIIWPQLEGGFDGDFAGLASGSICEIEINSTPWQKVQTISFEFRVAGISIRTCHKWETLHRIRMRITQLGDAGVRFIFYTTLYVHGDGVLICIKLHFFVANICKAYVFQVKTSFAKFCF